MSGGWRFRRRWNSRLTINLYHKPFYLELLNPWVRWVLNLILIFLVQIKLILTIFKGAIKCAPFLGLE